MGTPTGNTATPGQRLRSLRGNLKATQIADMLGISKQHFSNLENGAKRPSVEVAARIEALLGMPAAAWAAPIAPHPPSEEPVNVR